MLSVYHYAFAQQFVTQVLPHLVGNDLDIVKGYVDEIKTLYPEIK